MRKMRLFKLADQSEAPHYLVDAIHDERGYARVRRALARQYDPGERDPNIQVADVDLKGSRRLVLTHQPAQRRAAGGRQCPRRARLCRRPLGL